MRITVGIPTNADLQRLERLAYELTKTHNQENTDIIIVDNCNTFGHDIHPYIDKIRKKYRGSVRLLVLPERVGLTSAWKACTDLSETDWTVLCNDDTYFMPAWDLTFRSLVERKPGFGCYLLCEPYNWSGFAVNKAFIEEFPWRTEFPAGYYEDDDIYLRVAQARGLTERSEIYSKGIYCLPDNERTANGTKQKCFQHNHDNAESRQSEHYTRWDDKANKVIFNKYWKEVPAGTPNAIQGKRLPNANFFVAQT